MGFLEVALISIAVALVDIAIFFTLMYYDTGFSWSEVAGSIVAILIVGCIPIFNFIAAGALTSWVLIGLIVTTWDRVRHWDSGSKFQRFMTSTRRHR